MPKISVIIPVYKVENTLNRCVESVINQTLTDIEIILVDDGSPDECPKMCDYYAKLDNRIKVIHKENGGLGYARNSGLEIASGEYIGFVDSDDYIESTMYEKLYSCAVDSSADAVYGGIFYVNNGSVVPSNFEKNPRVCTGRDEVKNFLMDLIASDISVSDDSKYGATVWKAIFSHRIITDNNIRFVSERDYVSEDSVFDVSFLTRAEKVIMLPDNFYYYDYNPNSLTAVYRKDRFEKNKKLYELIKKMLLDEYGDKDLVAQYGRSFIAAARVCMIQEALNGQGAKGIGNITDDMLLQQVLKQYPWMKLSFKKRVFAFCSLYRLNFFICSLVKISYYRRRQNA